MRFFSFRRLGWIVLGGLALVGLLLAALSLLGSHWGQQRLENYLRARLARHTTLVLAPLQVEVSLWRDFPNLTVAVRHLSLTDTAFGRRVPVLRVGRAELRLTLAQVWRGEWQARYLALHDGQLVQLTDSLGHDWSLRGQGPHKRHPTGPPDFTLDSLVLHNVRVLDRNELQHGGFSAQVYRGGLRVRVRDGVARVRGRLAGRLDYLRTERGNLFERKDVRAWVRYRYNFRRREGHFRRTQATLNGDTLLVNGTHRSASPGQPRGTTLNLRFAGYQPLLEVLRVALPAGLERFLEGARTTSHAFIVYTLRGRTGPTSRPRTVLRFQLSRGQLQWADSSRRIRRWDARGTFDNGAAHAPRSTSLVFDYCRLYSQAGELQATLAVRDFTRPYFRGQVRGRTDLPTLAAVVAPGFWQAQRGQAALNLTLDGPLPRISARARLRPDTLFTPLRVTGSVQLRRATFRVPRRQAVVRDMAVDIRLQGPSWQLTNLDGYLNGMHLQANAQTTHLLDYLSGQRKTTFMEGSVWVDELRLPMLRQLLRPPTKARSRQHRARRTLSDRALNLVPPGLLLALHLRCQRLALASDTLTNLAAYVRHDGRHLHLDELRAEAWSGQLTGQVSWATDTLRPQPVEAELRAYFPVLNYERIMARASRPPRRNRRAATELGLRELLLAANGHTEVRIDQLRLPDNGLTNLQLQIRKQGPSFSVPLFTFNTNSGGQGQARILAHLNGIRLERAHADLALRYDNLDVQELLQLLAALGSAPAPGAGEARPRPTKAGTRPSPFLDGTITAQVQVQAQRVAYGALQGQQLRLLSYLEAGAVQVEACEVAVLGGHLLLRGTLQTAGVAGTHPLHAQVELQQVELPALFGLARTLGLDVPGPNNVRGLLQTRAELRTTLGRTFLPSLAATQAFLRTDVTGLELLEVDAITQALRLLRWKRTGHIYFEPLSTRLVLDGNRLLIPGLNLSSNLTDLSLAGTYRLDGEADLYVGLSPMQALFGNNNRRVGRVQSGEAARRPSRGLVYLSLHRQPGTRYQVRFFQKKAQQRARFQVQQQYQRVIQQAPLDTTQRLPAAQLLPK